MGKALRILGIAATAGALLAPLQAAAHDEPVIGVLSGAGIGAVVAGPPGAVVGAIVGTIIGSHVAHESDHGRKPVRATRRVQHSKAAIRPVAVRTVSARPADARLERPVAMGPVVPVAAPSEPLRPAPSAPLVREPACEMTPREEPNVTYVERRSFVPAPAARPKTKTVCRQVPIRGA